VRLLFTVTAWLLGFYGLSYLAPFLPRLVLVAMGVLWGATGGLASFACLVDGIIMGPEGKAVRSGADRTSRPPADASPNAA
jgi:hypothetical protein